MFSIFTDGACNFNKAGANNKGGCAFVVINDHGVKIKEDSHCIRNTTNNRMELTAVIKSLEYFNKHHPHDHVKIYSDSKYVVDCILNKWYVRWEKNNWMLGKETPVKNIDLWKSLLELITDHVKFEWVKGHTHTNVWNIYVDKLAEAQTVDKTITNTYITTSEKTHGGRIYKKTNKYV